MKIASFWPDRDSCERYSYLLILAGYCSEAGRKSMKVRIVNTVGQYPLLTWLYNSLNGSYRPFAASRLS